MERAALDRLAAAGFSFAVSPTAWPEFRSTDVEPRRPNSFHCTRRWDLCPDQGRYFGDKGSLVDFFDPLNIDFAVIRKAGVPPFGPMVAWRLFTSFECTDGCDRDDMVLHRWLLSSPVFVMQYPASSTGSRRKAPLHCHTATRLHTMGQRRSQSV